MRVSLTHNNLVFLLSLFISTVSFAQKSLKFENGGGPGGSGSSTSNKVVTLYNGDAGVYSPTTTVTYSLSNQQYSSIEGNSNIPGLVFGGTINGSGNTPGSSPYYGLMNRISGSQNSQYSTNGATPAINVGNDYAIGFATYSDALINSGGANQIPTDSKNVYYGDLTLSFNRPVNNPVIHITGLGGFYNGNNGTLGFAAGVELTNSAYTLSRLTGNFAFSVINNNKVYNSSTEYTSATGTGSPSAASGSVVVNGNNITSLTFRILMNGDRANRNWSSTNQVNGDEFLIAISLTTYNISGSVFDDANGMQDNTVNGIGSNAGGLNAVLIDPATNKVVATVPVNSDGTYNFTNILSGNYSIGITKNSVNAGDPYPGSVLPDGWTATGEHLGTGSGSDGTADGILTGITLNNNISDANFGIEKTPVTDNKSQEIATLIGNGIPQGTLTTGVSGTDAEDGTLNNNNKIVITELPSNGTMYYNGQAVTTGQTIDHFDPSLLSFTDIQGGSKSIAFKYSFIDAAGKQSTTPGTYTVSWNTPLPVTFGTITAKLSGNQLLVNWTVLNEINNDHFEVEVSKDGVHFVNAGNVASKAVNGNSDTALTYSFSKDADKASAMAGVSLFLITGFLSLAFHKKSRSKISSMMALMVIGCTLSIAMFSCTKKDVSPATPGSKLFVRIVQVDKDGYRGDVSKVIIVTAD